MDTRTERANFGRFLPTLRDEIESRHRQPGIRIKQQIHIGRTDTDGWSAELLYWPEAKVRLEAWYDHYVSRRNRALWVGFRAPPERISAYFDKLSVDIHAKKKIDDDQVTHASASMQVLFWQG